jgi:tRNA threonylcarbamoyladenosine biosynthesis protein TsaB
MNDTLNFLAFETSTDKMSVAVSEARRTSYHHGAGGPNASAQLIPVIQDLLGQAQLTLNALTALVIGQGPGSFTGLRTACSVAQGLALGAHLKVIQVDTLMAVAEEARFQRAGQEKNQMQTVGVLMDARMGEVYAGACAWQPESNEWQSVLPLQVGPPEAMVAVLSRLPKPWDVLAGNGLDAQASAMPHALALLRLAPALWARGQAVLPEQVQPLYIRDKVAQTTAEREAIKAAKSISI